MPKDSTETKKSTRTPTEAAEQEANEPIVFEDALAELESLVGQMEGGDLSLNDSLKAFERGVTLARMCQTALKDAELRVQSLSAEGELTDLTFDD